MAQSNAKPVSLTNQDGDVKFMAQSNGDEELRDKIKFEVLVPFATYLDPTAKASLLFEEGKVVNEQNVYESAIDKIEALILADRKQHELDARIDELTSYGEEVGLFYLRVTTELHKRIKNLKAERANSD